jgi:hypothetical protein
MCSFKEKRVTHHCVTGKTSTVLVCYLIVASHMYRRGRKARVVGKNKTVNCNIGSRRAGSGSIATDLLVNIYY